MQFGIFLIFLLVSVLCVFVYMTYRANTEKSIREKKRDKFNDRV